MCDGLVACCLLPLCSSLPTPPKTTFFLTWRVESVRASRCIERIGTVCPGGSCRCCCCCCCDRRCGRRCCQCCCFRCLLLLSSLWLLCFLIALVPALLLVLLGRRQRMKGCTVARFGRSCGGAAILFTARIKDMHACWGRCFLLAAQTMDRVRMNIP